MNDINAKAEVSSAWRKFIRDIFDTSSDPVKHCELYHNEDGNGSCPHVDGMLCDYPCDMLKRYRATKDKALAELAAERGHTDRARVERDAIAKENGERLHHISELSAELANEQAFRHEDRQTLEIVKADLAAMTERAENLDTERRELLERMGTKEEARIIRALQEVTAEERDAARAEAESAKQEAAGLRALLASAGILAIAQERQRQISAEGRTPDHDDEHQSGELADAAACYARFAAMGDASRKQMMTTEKTPAGWPWDNGWWKPKTRRRDLERAGALIAAEIDRLDRAAGVEVADE